MWDEDASVTNDASGLTPACYYPPDYSNYELDHLVNDTIILKKTSRSSGFPDDVASVKVDIMELDDDRLRIRLTDSMRERWEPPLPVIRAPAVTHHSTSDRKQYTVDIDLTQGLMLTIKRKATGAIVMQTDLLESVHSTHLQCLQPHTVRLG